MALGDENAVSGCTDRRSLAPTPLSSGSLAPAGGRCRTVARTSEHTFVAADGARVIRPHFAPLGDSKPPPVLIFLEDTTLLEEKVQQSKLAALGRLSASIAHEIRNPVGAMSHAGQLLAESPHLTEDERRLTEIIRTNAGRVSGIIDNVQRLSRREPVQQERLSLVRPGWKSFTRSSARPCSGRARVLLTASSHPEVEARVDPNQLRQIVWNLCENAIKHAVGADDETLGRRAAWRPHERHGAPLSGGRRSRPRRRRGTRRADLRAFLQWRPRTAAWASFSRASWPRATARHSCTNRARAAAASSGWCSPIRVVGKADERDGPLISAPPPPQPVVLVIDDEPDLIELVSLTLERMNLNTESAGDLATARTRLLRAAFRFVSHRYAPARR